MKNERIKVWELSLLLALCICLCQAVLETGRQRGLEEKILRLHVVASSDEEEAQALKLRVRDAVLAVLEPLLAKAESAEQAEKLVEENAECILAAAVSEAGEKVELRLGRESFGYRVGDGYALPPGEYRCLRIIIGEGAGHNWWGVIFPQLTLEEGAVETSAFPEDDGVKVIFGEERLELRFRFLEMLEKLGRRLNSG